MTFHPAFELAGSRYAPGTGARAATTFDGIADNGSGGAAVLGDAVADWQTQIYTGSLPTPVRKGQTVTAKFADLPALTFTMV